MTASWAFWDLEEPTEADIEDSQIPSLSVPEEPRHDSEGVCIHCQINQLVEAQETLSADVWELKQSIEFLSKIIGGK